MVQGCYHGFDKHDDCDYSDKSNCANGDEDFAAVHVPEAHVREERGVSFLELWKAVLCE